jgi:hypothetical protein
MTWIGFFSNLGGLFGLVLGMGIIFLFELLWFLCSIVKVLLLTSDNFASASKYFMKKQPKPKPQRQTQAI